MGLAWTQLTFSAGGLVGQLLEAMCEDGQPSNRSPTKPDKPMQAKGEFRSRQMGSIHLGKPPPVVHLV